MVVGLGNPGSKYETTRHNAGFLAVDRLVEHWKAQGPSRRFEAEVFQAQVGGETVCLVKPQTFMNLSGKSVGPLMGFYKCAPEDLIVLHDELDIAPLSLRIKTGGGAGGHNGLRSIDQHLGAANTGYHRVRIGVGQGTLPTGARKPAEVHVLELFTDAELEALDPCLGRVVEAVELLVRGDVQEAMNQFNKK